MWSKKWYLKRNISCDAHLLNELLETDLPWDDAIVVSAGKLRKLWDSLSEMHSSLCERWLKRTILRPVLLPVKTAQFTQFFYQVWHHTVKSLSLTVYKVLNTGMWSNFTSWHCVTSQNIGTFIEALFAKFYRFLHCCLAFSVIRVIKPLHH
jgi:hypothetical protein